MEELFLDIDVPDFKEQEKKIKNEGYIERKYTSSAAKDIEAAFRRHLLKQLIPSRGLTTPSQIEALKPELNELVKTTLYKPGPNGAKVFKFKMYIPSEKLIKQREAALMEENIEEEEFFAPENYGKLFQKEERKKSKINTQNVELANLMSKISLGNMPVKMPKMTQNSKVIINEDYIEDILNINNNNNNNDNDNVKNKLWSKVLITGRQRKDIKFIKDVVTLFIKKGMDKKMAIKLGTILANLSEEEFKMIQNTVMSAEAKKMSEMTIAEQLAQYLLGKMSGGKRRKTYKKHKYSKRRHTSRK